MRKALPILFLLTLTLGLPALGAYIGHRLTYLKMRKQPWQVNSLMAERVAKWRQNETMAGAYAIAKTPLDGVEKCYYTPPDFTRVSWTSRDMPTPFVGYAPQPGDIASGHINSLQFRYDHELPKKKPKGTFRVFLVGGSTAYSAGASGNARTIGGYLESQLAAPSAPPSGGGSRRVEVITAAASGWTSTNERIMIENRIAELEPDLVIALSGHNDAFFSSFDKNILWSRGYQDDHYFFLINTLLDCNFGEPFPDADPGKGDSVSPELMAKRLAHNLTLAHTALKPSGAKYVFALQPIIGASQKPLTAREQKMAERAAQAALLPRYDAIRQKLSKLDLPNYQFLDLTGCFDQLDGETDVFLDGCHFGDRGNDLIARAIAQHLTIEKTRKELTE
jgi:lysophospholipase L1-like esterase